MNISARKSFSITLALLFTSNAASQTISRNCLTEKIPEIKELNKGSDNYVIFDSELNTSESDWKQLAQEHHRLASEFSKRGIDLTVLLIPHRAFIDPTILDPTNDRQKRILDLDSKNFFNDIIDQFSNTSGKAINVLPEFRKAILDKGRGEIFFIDEFHWKQAGAVIAAEKTAKFLKTKGFNYDANQYSVVKTGSEKLEPVLPTQKLYDACSISPNLLYQSYDVAKLNEPLFSGFYPLERDGDKSWRWAKGPSSDILINSDTKSKKELTFSFESPIENQSLNISLNGKVIYRKDNMPPSEYKDIKLNIDLVKGLNTVKFATTDWNRRNSLPSRFGNDQRFLSINITSFNIEGANRDDSIGLLDDYNPEIHLIGTSYSKYMQLAKLLKGSSGSDVLDFTRESGGIYGSMSEYVEQLKEESKPKIIIWEMPLMWPSANAKQEIDRIISKFTF